MNGHVPKPFDPDTLVAAVLRATAARHHHTSDRSVCVPIDKPTIVETRVIGSGLMIVDVKAFERTASFLEPDRGHLLYARTSPHVERLFY